MEPIERVRVVARDGELASERFDALAVEEPLEIRVRGASEPPISFVTTMRTPGADEDLVAGLLVSEGVLEARDDLLALERPSDPRVDPELRENVLVATLAPAARARVGGLVRGTLMGSACGVCGRTTIEDVLRTARGRPAPGAGAPTRGPEFAIAYDVLVGLPDRLRAAQSVFAATGGLHAAALFDASGAVIEVREDVGRHNATDKVLGARWRAGAWPVADAVLLVSGRAGFEIVQKAVVAGVKVVVSVSAPSSLAVELAESAGVTLVGFLRERRCNVYAHPARVRG